MIAKRCCDLCKACLTLYVAAHIQFACRRWFLRPVWTGVNQVGAQGTDMAGLEQVGTAICNNSQFQYRDARQGTIYVFRTNQEIAACCRLDRCNGSCAMCGVLMQPDGSQRCRGCCSAPQTFGCVPSQRRCTFRVFAFKMGNQAELLFADIQ